MTLQGLASRRRILELISANPGISKRDLATRTGFVYSTVWYHLEILAAEGFVVSRLDGRKLRFSLHPTPPPTPAARIMTRMTAQGITLTQLKHLLRLPGPVVREELTNLLWEGKIMRRGKKRPRYYRGATAP